MGYSDAGRSEQRTCAYWTIRKLQLGKPRVQAVLAQKRVMRSCRDDPACIQDNNPIGTPDSRKPMSDDEGCPAS
jgi:hypothetical protein